MVQSRCRCVGTSGGALPQLCIQHARSLNDLTPLAWAWWPPCQSPLDVDTACSMPRVPSSTPLPFAHLPTGHSLPVFRGLFPSSGQLRTSSGPENFCVIVSCNHTFFNKVWPPAMGRGPPSKAGLPWVLSLSPRLPLRVLFVFSYLCSYHSLVILCTKLLLLSYCVISHSWWDSGWPTRTNQTHFPCKL